VVSSAIKADNPELLAARERAHAGDAARRDARRADALPPRHRRGRHARQDDDHQSSSPACSPRRLDPTFVIGGQLIAAGANARLGTGDYLVAEADESDGSFLLLQPVIAVVTNIDADHLENYGGDFAQVKKAFADFLHRLPFYGVAVLCLDDAEVRDTRARRRRAACSPTASHAAATCARPTCARRARHALHLHLPEASRVGGHAEPAGPHNVLNALAACAVGWQLGVAAKRSQRRWRSSRASAGASRCAANWRSMPARPCWSTTTATTRASSPRCSRPPARGWPERRLVVAFQPHRYTRTRDLLDDFANVLSRGRRAAC
jgi:UDP-N-acetylmuramate--alanine ligase